MSEPVQLHGIFAATRVRGSCPRNTSPRSCTIGDELASSSRLRRSNCGASRAVEDPIPRSRQYVVAIETGKTICALRSAQGIAGERLAQGDRGQVRTYAKGVVCAVDEVERSSA